MIFSDLMQPGQPAGGQQASDQWLLSRFRRGSEDAATAIYLRYANRLRMLASRQFGPELAPRLDPDDIVQSVFRTFFRRAARGEYQAPDGEELWRLLLVIALHKIRGQAVHHRAAKRDVGATVGCSPQELQNVAGEADFSSLVDLRMVVEESLASLPKEHRTIIELRIVGDQVEEIAAKTGRAKRSVERILQSFRKSLAAQLDI